MIKCRSCCDVSRSCEAPVRIESRMGSFASCAKTVLGRPRTAPVFKRVLPDVIASVKIKFDVQTRKSLRNKELDAMRIFNTLNH